MSKRKSPSATGPDASRRREPHLHIPSDPQRDIPKFTESLDAKVTDENIVFVKMEESSGKWIAVHRSKDARLYIGIAHTEVLARRSAALRGFQSKQRGATQAMQQARRGPADLTDLAATLDSLIRQVQSSNELAMLDPDRKKEVLTELEAGRSRLSELLSNPLLVLPMLLPPLCYIATKFTDAAIGELAKVAITHLRTLVGG